MVSPRLKRQKRNLSPMSSLILTILKSIVFNFALNSKRSTCETAAKKCVVDETWPKFKKQGKTLFTIKELCKLRQAETEREMEAFFWFFGEFLVSVCGARQWGKQKEHELISKATLMGAGKKLVTKSDEAFALLMYENYIGKWKKQGNIKTMKTNSMRKTKTNIMRKTKRLLSL